MHAWHLSEQTTREERKDEFRNNCRDNLNDDFHAESGSNVGEGDQDSKPAVLQLGQHRDEYRRESHTLGLHIDTAIWTDLVSAQFQ
jgi:hypothetical protein